MTKFEQWSHLERVRIDLTLLRDNTPESMREYWNENLKVATKKARTLMNQLRPKSQARVIYRSAK